MREKIDPVKFDNVCNDLRYLPGTGHRQYEIKYDAPKPDEATVIFEDDKTRYAYEIHWIFVKEGRSWKIDWSKCKVEILKPEYFDPTSEYYGRIPFPDYKNLLDQCYK